MSYDPEKPYDYLDPDHFLTFDAALGLPAVAAQLTKREIIDAMRTLIFNDNLVDLYYTKNGFLFRWNVDNEKTGPYGLED
tara:strand:+ start:399 stop:638 length:240 start_codon:yes stop_codon:yes gene_type:complete